MRSRKSWRTSRCAGFEGDVIGIEYDKMLKITGDEIRNAIKELCSEDAWGSWELWWQVSQNVPESEFFELKEIFLDTVDGMVASGELIPKRHHGDGKWSRSEFNRSELSAEIDSADHPEPNAFFWFGTE